MKNDWLAFVLLLISCNSPGNQHHKYGSPAGYQLQSPEQFDLSYELEEISGIAYANNDLGAINDENGILYKVKLTNEATITNSWKFGKPADFEDVVFTGIDWYVLESDGTIYEIHNLADNKVNAISYNAPEGLNYEFESLYFDKRSNSLILLPKSGKKRQTKEVPAFRFELAHKQFVTAPFFEIDVKAITGLVNEPGLNFRPSAAAIHPIENKLYILDSINKLMVIADLNGKVEAGYLLDDDLFRQPEGISFAPNGDLYISNEAAGRRADILKFAYRPN